MRQLHGMFAFALWDARRAAAAARPRPGRQEAAALLRCATGCSASPPRWARCSATTRSRARSTTRRSTPTWRSATCPRPLTALRGVRKLPPAHTLTLRDGKAELRALLEARLRAPSSTGVPIEELCERVRAGLRGGDAAPDGRRRAARRVPLRRHRLVRGRRRDGRAVGGAGAHVLDRLRPPGVRRAALRAPDRRALRHRARGVPGRAPTRSRSCPKIVRHYGEPFADSSAIPSFYLAELTRRHVTVALNGDGGDETFAGYTRYVANALAGRLDLIPGALRAARRRGRGARLPAGGRVASVGEQGPPARGDARARRARSATPATCRGSTAPSAASSTRPEFAASAGRRRGRDRRVMGRRVRRDGGRQDARGRRRDLPRRRPDRQDRHRDDGPRARGPLALPRPRADAARRLDPRLAARSAARRRSGSCARRCGAGCRTRSSTARSRASACRCRAGCAPTCASWARDVLLDRETLDRGYFEPDAVSRLLDRHAAGADGDDKRIWSLLMLELWHREFVDAPASTALRAAA